MGAHTKKEGQEGQDTKANPHLGRVARASPLCAKQAVLLVTVVADTLGKVATLEVGVNVLPFAITRWDPQNLALAALQEAVANNGPAVEQFAPVIYKPNDALFSRWSTN